jgi:hypothetical protein
MSYDVYLRGGPCTHCGLSPPEPDLPDPTYNLGPIFTLALTGRYDPKDYEGETHEKKPYSLHTLNGRKAKETFEELRAAVKRLEDPALSEQFRKLEPENKWGTLEDALEVMKTYLTASAHYPDFTWEVR